MALDADNSVCLDYYGRFITLLRDGKFGMSQHRMAGSQFFAPREVAADVFATNLGYREKSRVVAIKVENAFSGAKRLPADADPPYPDFAALKSASEQPSAQPEALYWRGRVDGLGQLGQPVDLASAHDWSCKAAKAGHLRGQVDCWLSQPSLDAQFVPANLLMVESVVEQKTDLPAAAWAAMAYARKLDGVSKQLRDGDLAANALSAEFQSNFGSGDRLQPGLTSKDLPLAGARLQRRQLHQQRNRAAHGPVLCRRRRCVPVSATGPEPVRQFDRQRTPVGAGLARQVPADKTTD